MMNPIDFAFPLIMLIFSTSILQPAQIAPGFKYTEYSSAVSVLENDRDIIYNPISERRANRIDFRITVDAVRYRGNRHRVIFAFI